MCNIKNGLSIFKQKKGDTKMYKIEKTGYGIKLTFSGTIKREEMAKWVEDSKIAIKSLPKSFGVFVDMKDLAPLAPDAQEEMQKGQLAFKNAGMIRSAVILKSTTISMQFKRTAKETGIYAWERYIDASKNEDWEEKGRKWVSTGVDPDK